MVRDADTVLREAALRWRQGWAWVEMSKKGMDMPKNIELTTVEIELLEAICTGASNKKLAQYLRKSELTVRNQLSAVFRKINVDNRVQAALWCREYQRAKEMGGGEPFLPLFLGTDQQRIGRQ